MPTGRSYLYFGCRSRYKDYYYREQFEGMHMRGVLAEDRGLQVACSRDQPAKVYVQQLLAANSEQLFALICEVQIFPRSFIMMSSVIFLAEIIS